MKVPYLDLARENIALLPELLEATERVMRSGRVLYGAELEAFEHEIAQWHGTAYAIGVASGTDAVEIALRATGAKAEFVTALTAPATINAMEAADVRPILVDIDPITRNAVGCGLQVHLYGLAEDACGQDVVEDVAHSMGATINGMLAGTMGRCGAISFYPSKIMGTVGDGGVVITNDKEIADKCRLIRHYGIDETGNIATRGQNSRLCELQAAYLRVKLPHVRRWISRRQELARRYGEELHDHVKIPAVPDDDVERSRVFHVYVVESDERDRIAAELKKQGIGTMQHYNLAIHQYARWSHLGEPGQFPHAEALARTCLSLPLYPYMRDEEQSAVIAAVKACT